MIIAICIVGILIIISLSISAVFTFKNEKARAKTLKVNSSLSTASYIAERRYGRNIREYKDLVEYYNIERNIKYPSRRNPNV